VENTHNHLFGKTLAELSQIVNELALPAFSAKQIADWLYKKNISSIEQMTNISAKYRSQIAKKYDIGVSLPLAEQTSTDGTKKYMFEAKDAGNVHATYIPDKQRHTLCISSQAGCKMGCKFCITGKQKMKGNLSTTSILNQLHSLPEREKITNIVFMGMGEPFDNTDNVMKSLEILTADYGYAMAPKRITVSTVGVLPVIRTFMNNSRAHLAVSLNHPNPAERQKLMPIEAKYPIQKIIELLKTFDINKQRRISFEYVMLGGINDSLQTANETVRLLSGLRCRVNLIPFHTTSDKLFKPSDEQTIRMFAEILSRKGILTTVRRSRGKDINAACGMLKT
jgi:23S rRNA (adenine2503-C2)-methyltransferase